MSDFKKMLIQFSKQQKNGDGEHEEEETSQTEKSDDKLPDERLSHSQKDQRQNLSNSAAPSKGEIDAFIKAVISYMKQQTTFNSRKEEKEKGEGELLDNRTSKHPQNKRRRHHYKTKASRRRGNTRNGRGQVETEENWVSDEESSVSSDEYTTTSRRQPTTEKWPGSQQRGRSSMSPNTEKQRISKSVPPARHIHDLHGGESKRREGRDHSRHGGKAVAHLGNQKRTKPAVNLRRRIGAASMVDETGHLSVYEDDSDSLESEEDDNDQAKIGSNKDAVIVDFGYEQSDADNGPRQTEEQDIATVHSGLMNPSKSTEHRSTGHSNSSRYDQPEPKPSHALIQTRVEIINESHPSPPRRRNSKTLKMKDAQQKSDSHSLNPPLVPEIRVEDFSETGHVDDPQTELTKNTSHEHEQNHQNKTLKEDTHNKKKSFEKPRHHLQDKSNVKKGGIWNRFLKKTEQIQPREVRQEGNTVTEQIESLAPNGDHPERRDTRPHSLDKEGNAQKTSEDVEDQNYASKDPDSIQGQTDESDEKGRMWIIKKLRRRRGLKTAIVEMHSAADTRTQTIHGQIVDGSNLLDENSTAPLPSGGTSCSTGPRLFQEKALNILTRANYSAGNNSPTDHSSLVIMDSQVEAKNDQEPVDTANNLLSGESESSADDENVKEVLGEPVEGLPIFAMTNGNLELNIDNDDDGDNNHVLVPAHVTGDSSQATRGSTSPKGSPDINTARNTPLDTPIRNRPIGTTNQNSSTDILTRRIPIDASTRNIAGDILAAYTLSRNTPVDSSTRNTPVDTPTRNTPTDTPTRNTPVGTLTGNTPSDTPRNTPADTPTRNTLADMPTRNTPAGTLTDNTPSDTPTGNSPTNSPARNIPVMSQSSSEFLKLLQKLQEKKYTG